MQTSPPAKAHWATSDSRLWKQWRGYTVRWLLFCEIVQLFQPIVDDPDRYWQQKLGQALTGLIFGAACAVVFTLAENTLNHARTTWKSWLLVIATWLAVKVAFVSVMAAAGW
jgi:hypothetical protein